MCITSAGRRLRSYVYYTNKLRIIFLIDLICLSVRMSLYLSDHSIAHWSSGNFAHRGKYIVLGWRTELILREVHWGKNRLLHQLIWIVKIVSLLQRFFFVRATKFCIFSIVKKEYIILYSKINILSFWVINFLKFHFNFTEGIFRTTPFGTSTT